MAQKWNLQDIRPVEPRRKRNPAAEGGVVHRPPRVADAPEEIPTVAIENGTKKKRGHLVVAIAVFFLIILGGLGASALMGGAEVTVYPRNREPNLNATLAAYRDPRPGELTYEIMTLEGSGERQVTATGQETVEELATGEIEIVKTTPGAERLIKNTRFESPDGLIYRIEESIVVPGAVTDGTGSTVPGTITAKVFAEDTGEEYNLPADTRFVIPGFREGGFTELFESMYAINRTAMSGGYEGPRFIIDEGELATARQALQMELRDSLLARIPTERPAGYVVFDDAVTFTYDQLPPVEYGDNLVTIKEQATLQIPIFKEEDFAAYIAAATVPGYEGNPVRIDDYATLDFSYTTATTSATNIANLPALNFKVSGRPLLVWEYDEEKLKRDLAGASKTAQVNILTAYPSIESATTVIRPFWKRAFPESADDIDIIETIRQAE